MTAPEHKPCAHCRGPIYRKPKMGPKHFEQRKYCSNSCGALASRSIDKINSKPRPVVVPLVPAATVPLSSLSFAGQDDPRASQPEPGRVHRPDHDRSLIGNGARLCVS
jgi:hypothetical protein